MFDGYVDWLYEAMRTKSVKDFEAALWHCSAALGMRRCREAFEEARDMMVN